MKKITKIFLIGCGAKKSPNAVAAGDLYLGDLFKKSREYAEARLGDSGAWFILSAKFGLLDPRMFVEPYDLTLSSLKPHDRYLWAVNVAAGLSSWPRIALRADDRVEFIILAGENYRTDLVGQLRQFFPGCEISIPMEGLGIGEQLHFLTVANAAASGEASGETPWSDQLLGSMTQEDRAEIYRNFCATWNNEEAARIAIETGELGFIENHLIARILDDRRAAALRAAATTSPKKAEAARNNGRKGGRPRLVDPTPAAMAKRRSRARHATGGGVL